MKTTILKSMMMVLMALFSLNANAYDVEIDGIYYNLIKKAKQAKVTNYSDKGASYYGEVTIPSTIIVEGLLYDVTSIDVAAFYNCSNLESVTIPNSITDIGESAFRESRLTSITIPNSVTSIGAGAFYHCEYLSSVTIPNSVTAIGGGAFSGCI